MASSKYDKEKLHQMLEEFRLTGDAVLRARLIEAYMPFASITARRIVSRFTHRTDLDHEDLASAGMIGLVKAIDTYDPRHSAQFETFCIMLVRGAIYDELRRYETSLRISRANLQVYNKKVRDLEKKLGRPATEEELTSLCPAENAPSGQGSLDAHRGRCVSLNTHFAPPSGNDKRVRWNELIEDSRSASPIEELMHQEIKKVLIDQCNERERQLLVLYYFENLNLKQIGEVLGVKEARVSQIHREMLRKLEHRLEHRRDELFILD